MSQTTIRAVTAWIAQILSAGIVFGAALGKLLGTPGWIERFRNWGYPDGFYLVIGVLTVRRTRGRRPYRDHARRVSHTSHPR